MPSSAVLLAAPRRTRVRRTPLLALAGLLVAAWVVFSFGRTLTTLNSTSDRLADMRAENAAIQLRIEQGRAEMELAQTPAFQRMLARSFGMGLPGERAFALDAAAPPAPVVVPLGREGGATAGTPLDAWLSLLLGD